MFRVNRQTDYAIRMLLSLAKRGAGMRASTTEIQKEMVIPPALAQRIVADLARGAFILTYPGRDGGMTLARPANEINLRQLVEHFEEKMFDTNCEQMEKTCPFEMDCPICVQWKELQVKMLSELEQVNFEDLAKATRAPKVILPLGWLSQ